MTIELLRNVLLWCVVIDYAVLLVWAAVFVWGHEWLYGLHGRWFRIPVERFDALHYAGMAALKIGIIVFALAPYLALSLVA